MHKLAVRYPGYGWENNVGYATRRHLQGLREHGLTPFHRLAYAPVRTFILQPTTLDDLIDQMDRAESAEGADSLETVPVLA
jgi:ribonuclease HII